MRRAGVGGGHLQHHMTGEVAGGQQVLADPDTGLVLVQTSLSSDDFLDLELAALWTAARSQLR